MDYIRRHFALQSFTPRCVTTYCMLWEEREREACSSPSWILSPGGMSELSFHAPFLNKGDPIGSVGLAHLLFPRRTEQNRAKEASNSFVFGEEEEAREREREGERETLHLCKKERQNDFMLEGDQFG